MQTLNYDNRFLKCDLKSMHYSILYELKHCQLIWKSLDSTSIILRVNTFRFKLPNHDNNLRLGRYTHNFLRIIFIDKL